MIIIFFHVLFLIGKYFRRKLNVNRVEDDEIHQDKPALSVNTNNCAQIIDGSTISIDEFDDYLMDDDECRSDLKFSPPVYIQRYNSVTDILRSQENRGKIHKVVDFGCAELSFFNHLKHHPGIKEIICVDIDETLLESNKRKIEPLTADYLSSRDQSLTVKLFQGSVTDHDKSLENTDAVICIELIEHLYQETLDKLPKNIFENIKPKLAIFTTPNADFNVLFTNLKGFRHYDHKFEWSRAEFQTWSSDITKKYPNYEVMFAGIGQGPIGTEELGCCSQMAIFTRKLTAINNELSSLETDNNYYKLISEITFPYRIDNRTDEKKILDDAKYFIRRYQYNCDCDDEMMSFDNLTRLMDDRAITVESLREILINGGYTIVDDEERGTVIMLPPISGCSLVDDVDDMWNLGDDDTNLSLGCDDDDDDDDDGEDENENLFDDFEVNGGLGGDNEGDYYGDLDMEGGELGGGDQGNFFGDLEIESGRFRGGNEENYRGNLRNEGGENEKNFYGNLEMEGGELRGGNEENFHGDLNIEGGEFGEENEENFYGNQEMEGEKFRGENGKNFYRDLEIEGGKLEKGNEGNFHGDLEMEGGEFGGENEENFYRDLEMEDEKLGEENARNFHGLVKRDEEELKRENEENLVHNFEVKNGKSMKENPENLIDKFEMENGRLKKENSGNSVDNLDMKNAEKSIENCGLKNEKLKKDNEKNSSDNLEINEKIIQESEENSIHNFPIKNTKSITKNPENSPGKFKINHEIKQTNEQNPEKNDNFELKNIKTKENPGNSTDNSAGKSAENLTPNDAISPQQKKKKSEEKSESKSEVEEKKSTNQKFPQQSSTMTTNSTPPSPTPSNITNETIYEDAREQNDTLSMCSFNLESSFNDNSLTCPQNITDPNFQSIINSSTSSSTSSSSVLSTDKTKIHDDTTILQLTSTPIKKKFDKSPENCRNYLELDEIIDKNDLIDDKIVSLIDKNKLKMINHHENHLMTLINEERRLSNWSPEIISDSGYQNTNSATDLTPEFDLSIQSIEQDSESDDDSDIDVGLVCGNYNNNMGNNNEDFVVENGDLANNNRDNEGNNMIAPIENDNLDDLQPFIDVLENDLENENDIYDFQNGFPLWLLRIHDARLL